ncbi:unnamed protein product, partial [marine sediment metagenome]
SKLTWIEVEEIRNKYVPCKYSLRKLGKEYNVSTASIFNIIKEITWKT